MRISPKSFETPAFISIGPFKNTIIFTIFKGQFTSRMTRFFRKIRFRLTQNKQFLKYSKYAVGEIALVVIGILIALQINNWNEKRHFVEAEKQVYRNLKRQLQEDSLIIESNVSFNRRFLEQYQYALEKLQQGDKVKEDTIARISKNLMEFSDFHQQRNLYSTLVSSGDDQLITNDDVLSSLQHLDETYVYINKLEEAHFDVIKLIYQDLYNVILFHPVKTIDQKALFGYPIQNHFILSIDLCTEKEEIYKKALSRIHRIITLLELEIND